LKNIFSKTTYLIENRAEKERRKGGRKRERKKERIPI
jgi:hypothetical protein